MTPSKRSLFPLLAAGLLLAGCAPGAGAVSAPRDNHRPAVRVAGASAPRPYAATSASASGATAARAAEGGGPAAPLLGALPYLKPSTDIPVYLPSWLPSPDPGPAYWSVSAHATADSYTVGFNWSPHAVAVNAPAGVVMASLVGNIQGGPAGTVGTDPGGPWSWRPATGTPIALPGGRTGTFNDRWGIWWTQGGWTYGVVDLLNVPGTAAELMPLVDGILGDLGSAANPVGPHTTGRLLQDLAPDNEAMTLRWRQGAYSYSIFAYHGSGVRMAESLVWVRGGGGAAGAPAPAG